MAEYCAYDDRELQCAAWRASMTPEPPQLSERGYNKFLLRGAGKEWLLYLDLSDWATGMLDGARAVRSKLVSAVSMPSGGEHEDAVRTGWLMRTSEMTREGLMTYHMLHPSQGTGHYQLTAEEASLESLEAAELVLESERFNHMKHECRMDAAQTGGNNEEMQTPASSVSFDCETGLFTWTISGWRVQTSANGDIKKFIFASASPNHLEGSEDFEMRVLSQWDGGDAGADFALTRAFEMGVIFSGCGEWSTPAAVAASPRREPAATAATTEGRQLVITNKNCVLPGTNWCGPGQNPVTQNWCLDDYPGDWACRRHDACAKKEETFVQFIVNGCSCDKDLWDNRGDNSAWAAAQAVEALYNGQSPYPCIARTVFCEKYGWVAAGRRRRYGWWWFGISSWSKCDVWHYWDKYVGNITTYGYSSTSLGDLTSTASWTSCIANNGAQRLIENSWTC